MQHFKKTDGDTALSQCWATEQEYKESILARVMVHVILKCKPCKYTPNFALLLADGHMQGDGATAVVTRFLQDTDRLICGSKGFIVHLPRTKLSCVLEFNAMSLQTHALLLKSLTIGHRQCYGPPLHQRVPMHLKSTTPVHRAKKKKPEKC